MLNSEQKLTEIIKNQKGSILVFSILILSILTSISLAISAILLPKLRIANDAPNSAVAISAADSGLEWCLYLSRGKPTPEPLPPPSFEDGGSVVVYYPLDSTNIATCVSSESPMSHRAVGSYSGVTRSLEIEETGPPLPPPFTSATGGTITYADSSGLNPRSSPPYSGGYTIHTFTSDGTFTPNGSGNVEVLVVAGGGGGGNSDGTNSTIGGGGGAGGMVEKASHTVTAQDYSVTVGAGGPSFTNGGDSVFDGITAIGGGHGATYGSFSGGSGGGLEGCGGATVGGATTQGNSGGGIGYGFKGGDSANTGLPCATSGGGGAGGAGVNVSGSIAGMGGAGRANSISGVSVTYAGGGGSGYSNWGVAAGAGGSGGGGNGGTSGSPAGVAGTANRGAGGGGAGNMDPPSPGGAGGSGIVIIRYLTP
ncbi:MAG: hypothetical protein A2816_01020 [Candidatus Yanofskybacteria bacterium RIFCSPHIGHO2_01_FULL_39_44]|nr:MAG: hypothetical protein A2816_01020 [Candidatus Yanofskybacteria bacterium RIFCSPHIGHO2_01_FULL_39_44]